MNDELKTAFRSLNIQSKRNQIYNELLIIENIIKENEKIINIESDLITLLDNVNENISESEFLDSIYISIFNVQQELLTLISAYKNVMK